MPTQRGSNTGAARSTEECARGLWLRRLTTSPDHTRATTVATPFTLLRALLGAACNRPEPRRHSMESMQPPSTITPVALDMRLPDESLRETGRAAMRDTLTPMLAVHHHGCSEQLAELAARARAHHSLDDGATLPPQSACDFDGPLEPLAEETRAKLTALCTRLLEILTGEAPALEGRLCMRTYPQGETPLRLGAHCDNTLFTLLWAREQF